MRLSALGPEQALEQGVAYCVHVLIMKGAGIREDLRCASDRTHCSVLSPRLSVKCDYPSFPCEETRAERCQTGKVELELVQCYTKPIFCSLAGFKLQNLFISWRGGLTLGTSESGAAVGEAGDRVPSA